MQLHHIGWLVAGICALLAFLVICWVVFNHLLSYASPAVQRPMVRILIMVPVYAIDSWLSLVFKDYAQYFDLARDWHDPPPTCTCTCTCSCLCLCNWSWRYIFCFVSLFAASDLG